MSPETGKADCIFCKIIAGEIPSQIIYRDEDVVVFPDIKPVTPVHLMVVPVKHIVSLTTMQESETAIVGKMVKAANKVAKDKGFATKGYRLIINAGEDGGQVIQHLHMHLLAGRKMGFEN